MQIFHGTITLKSRPIDDGASTNCDGEILTPYERECATPVKIKAYGKQGGRLENLQPGYRIQVINGSLHRGPDYSYVIKPYKFHILPPNSETVIPDWHSIVLAGRTTNDLDTREPRYVFNNGEFLSITRPIAVNKSKNEADFFDIQAVSNANDKVNRAQQLMDYFHAKGTFIMVDGRFSSNQSTSKEGQKRIFTKIRVERLYFGPRTHAAPGAPASVVSSNGQYLHAEPVGLPDMGAQPHVPTEAELPF